MKKQIIKCFIVLGLVINVLFSDWASAQQAAIKQQAESQLQQMTPEEIDAKIKEYGMTREQAEAKAKELGINLETYLKSSSGNIGISPATPSEESKSSEVKVEVKIPETKQESSIDVKQTEPTVLQKSVKPTQLGPGGIPYFGYNVFKADASVFEPRPLIDDQYIIGENDVLSISLWGDFQSYNEYKVDKEGRILVNTVGPISVAGHTIEKARNIVLNAMSKVYSGLKKSPPSIFIDMSVARIRPLRIFIMGEVVNPGGYAVSAIGNVFNSLFSAGGPKYSGSLREIKVIRNNKVVSKVDLYDYLIGPQKNNDERMNDNDIIYIQLRGRTIGIKGAVMRSANFELLPNENLKKLLEFSGGIKNTFYLQRIQIDRIVPFEERKQGEPDRKIFDIDFKEIVTSGKDYKLEDGDIITVFPILDEKKNYVKIDGAVWRPGTYQLEKISTLKDLVKAADGLLPDVYPEHVKFVRTYDDKQTEIFYVNIDLAMKDDLINNIKLQTRDSVYIFSRLEMLAGKDNVTVEGMAKRPGKYPLHQNQTLYDIVAEAVGLSDTLFRKEIYLQHADLVRFNEDRYTTRIIPFNLWDLYENHSNDTLLLPGDQIIIYPITAIEFTDRYVDISGKVKNPGRYKLSNNMTVLGLILQAGGYTEDAWAVKGELSRLERTGIGKDSLTRIYIVDIPDFFDSTKITQQKLNEYRTVSCTLQHRDKLFIRPNPNYLFQKTVTLEGELEHSGIYVLSKLNERLSDVIKRAGGVKKSGYPEGGIVERTGIRMRIDVADAIDNPEGENDIMLQPNDIVTIPIRPFAVKIKGEVNNPGLFSYVEGKKLSFYVEQSGEITDSADFALITYPTGMIEKVGLHWWSSNPKIPDGSNINITKLKPEPIEPPEQGQKITVYDVVKDMTAVMISALTIVVLVKQLK